MKKVIFIPLVFILILLGREASFAQSSSNGDRSKNKSMKLFNGKNLDGWYVFLKDRGRDNDPKKVFTVQKGQIHVSGEEFGCITTNEEYENYKLTVEFKWGDRTFPPRVDNARDNGVLIHSNGIDGGHGGIWMHSIECQIIEGGVGDILVVGDGSDQFSATSPTAPEKNGGAYVYQPGGQMVTVHGGRINWYGRDPQWKDVKDFRGKQDVEKPHGKWNKLECIAEGDKVTIFVNGILVNSAINVKPSKGRIQLQSEGAEIMFRRVELTKLGG